MRFCPIAAQKAIHVAIAKMERHQSSCMVVLTAGLAASAFVSCHLSAKNIQAMKDMEIERTRPMVVLEVLQDMPFYGVRLRNAGLTAARDVIVHTVPEIELCFDDPEKPPIRFVKEKIDFFPPNASCQAMLGTMPQIQRINKTLVYRGTIQYADAMGRQYTDAVVLDYTLFNGTWYSDKTSIHDIVRELENMRGAIEGIGRGINQTIPQAFCVFHSIEHCGSDSRRIKNDSDKNGNLPLQGRDDGGFPATTSFPREVSEKTEEGEAPGKEENARHEPTTGAGEPINEPIKFGEESIPARVLAHVRQHPGDKRGDIVEALGISLSTARRALKALGGQVEYRGSKKTGGYFAKEG